ncbi:hypothetical protein Aduo_004064 [Ancylostoma duodenale]
MWLFSSNRPETLVDKFKRMKQVELADSKSGSLHQVSLDQSNSRLQQVELKEEQKSSYLPFKLPAIFADKTASKTDATATSSCVNQKSLTEKTEETCPTEEEGVRRRKKKSRINIRGRKSNVTKKSKEKVRTHSHGKAKSKERARRKKSRVAARRSGTKTEKTKDSIEEHSVTSTPASPSASTPTAASSTSFGSRVIVQRKIIPEIDYGMAYTEYEEVDAPKSPAIVEVLSKPGRKKKSRGKRISSGHPCDTGGGTISEFKTAEAYDTLTDDQKDVTGTTKGRTDVGQTQATISVDTEEENNEKPLTDIVSMTFDTYRLASRERRGGA